jgi:hypothetical protein
VCAAPLIIIILYADCAHHTHTFRKSETYANGLEDKNSIFFGEGEKVMTFVPKEDQKMADGKDNVRNPHTLYMYIMHSLCYIYIRNFREKKRRKGNQIRSNPMTTMTRRTRTRQRVRRAEAKVKARARARAIVVTATATATERAAAPLQREREKERAQHTAEPSPLSWG